MSSSFAELGVPVALATRLAARGITDPFPIQAAALPDALAGRDICGRAPTGSGKTLAFGLALVARTAEAKPNRPTALVLVPTRELAAQVEAEIAFLGSTSRIRTTCVYGGVGYEGQRRALARGVEVVVACPGRLEDLIESRTVILDDVRFVVLDEADRMADMGFLPAVKRILDLTPHDRQTLLFSATLDGEVDSVVKRYQTKPARHEVLADEDATGDVVHHFWRVQGDKRLNLAASVIAAEGRTIVFCRTKHGCDRIARQLGQLGIGTVALHGDRSQAQRDRAIAAFTDGRADVLVATDVAARGIHVDDVACVVHFDPPADAKDFQHRSGRTGRAGRDGVIVTFVTDEKRKDVANLQRALKSTIPVVDAPRLDPPPRRGPAVVDERPVRKASPDRAARPARSQSTPDRTRERAIKPKHATPTHRAPSGLPEGTVKFFDPKKGYGFIAREADTDVFVHKTAMEASGLRVLEPGTRVAFDLEPGRNGQEAHRLRIL